MSRFHAGKCPRWNSNHDLKKTPKYIVFAFLHTNKPWLYKVEHFKMRFLERQLGIISQGFLFGFYSIPVFFTVLEILTRRKRFFPVLQFAYKQSHIVHFPPSLFTSPPHPFIHGFTSYTFKLSAVNRGSEAHDSPSYISSVGH